MCGENSDADDDNDCSELIVSSKWYASPDEFSVFWFLCKLYCILKTALPRLVAKSVLFSTHHHLQHSLRNPTQFNWNERIQIAWIISCRIRSTFGEDWRRQTLSWRIKITSERVCVRMHPQHFISFHLISHWIMYMISMEWLKRQCWMKYTIFGI